MPGIPQLKVPPNASPIFPAEAFSPVDSSFQIPEAEVISSGSVSLSIVLAEPIIFLRGYTPSEYLDRSPSLLRGTLVVRAHKAVKIKTISLTFKGVARTDWPEGIPPKKSEIFESNELHSHTWPFFNASFPMSDFSSGANMIKLSKEGAHRRNLSVDKYERSHHRGESSSSLNSDSASERASTSRSRSNTVRSDSPDTKGVKGLAGRLRRAASPAPSFPKEQILHSLSLGPRRSFSKEEAIDTDTQAKGYRTFDAGEYFYNFELPLPQSLPESIEGNFGSVRYALEASIERPGAFRTKITGHKNVILVRCPADNNIEANEPIAISKQWEDQLYYDIVISGKAFPIGTAIPIAFKLTPLAKIELHRIRVYITENAEYYCRNKRVHRIEPNKKFLIEEKVSSEGLNGNLLLELASGVQMSAETLATSAELELNSVIPESFLPKKREVLHANTTYDNIKIHHWIKIVIRLSRPDPNPPPGAEPGKKKHYEISIESPIHLLDARCTNSNVYLPAYIDPVRRRTSTASMRGVPSNQVHENRPIHFLRKPSIAPPSFDADVAPPALARVPSKEAPPGYETAIQNETSSYVERFATYQKQRKQSYDEHMAEALARRKAERQSRPSTILETLHAHNEASPPAHPDASSISLSTSSSGSSTSAPERMSSDASSTLDASSTQDSSSALDASSSLNVSSPLNTSMFSTAEPPSAVPIPIQPLDDMRPRYQSTASQASVDIVDQPIDPDDPLSSQLRRVSSAASSIGPSDSAATSLDEMLPKLYLSGHSYERAPLLGGSAASRRISEASSAPPPLHGANTSSSRGRLDSSADIGVRANGGLEDDQMSMTSTTSLWIS